MKGDARGTFCQAQMKGEMIHQFKVILETIYNPVPQMLEPYQEIFGCSAAEDFFFFPSERTKFQECLQSLKSQVRRNAGNIVLIINSNEINDELKQQKCLIAGL